MKKPYLAKPKALLGTMGAILLGLMFVAQLVGLAGGSLGDLPLAHADEPAGPASVSPYVPYNPIPADGATNMPRSLSLKWQIDSLGLPGPFTYTVAFGTQNPPPVVVNNINSTSYNPGSLDDDAAYRWVVTVTRGAGFLPLAGPTWVFTTARQISRTYTISATGTNINTPDGVEIQLPSSSVLSDSTRLKYTSAPAVPNLNATALAFRLELFDAADNNITGPFTENITVTVAYSQSLIDNLGIDEDLLEVYYYDDSSDKWQPVTVIDRDTNANTITFVINHLTNFAVSAEQRVYLPVVLKN